MDTSTLRTFITIAETGSFSQAGEKLYLTQPAISKRIATLEQELDTRLFDRIGRNTTLTQAGKILYDRARQIMLEIEDSRRAIANLTDNIAGQLIIGTSHHIGLYRLPPVLRSYVAAYPEVELDIRFMDSEAACRGVKTGELELAIVTLPLEASKDIQVKIIWPDPLDIVAGASHPLAGKNHPVTIQALLKHSAILPGQSTYTRQVLQRAIDKTGAELKVSMSTNYLETIKMLTSIGLGWSVLPQTMTGNDLVCIKVKGVKLKRQLGAVWHSSRTLSNAAQAMLKILETFK